MPRLVKHTTRALHRRANFRPGLEPLEDRCVPAITWVAPGGGDWNDPNNWLDPVSLQHRLPAISQGDTVSLPGGEAFTVSNHAGCVSLSVGGMSTFTILGFAQLTVSESAGFDGSLSLANGLLTVGADFGVDDDLTMSGGSFLNLSATGVNDIGADFVWSSGRLAGGSPANPIQLHNPTTIIGPDLKTLHAFVINHDTVTQVGTATLTTNGGRMTNAVDGTYVLAGDGDFTVQNLTHFVNEGTLHKTSGAGVSSVGGFRSTPTGQVVADTGKVELLMFFNAVSNDLDVVVASGAQVSFTTGPNSAGTAGRFQGTLTASGAGKVLLEGSLQIGPAGAVFNVLPAGILEWTDTVGNVFATEGTLTNDGAMTLTGAASKRLEGTLINNGAIRHDGAGVLNIAGVTPGSTLLNNGLYELLSNAGIADGGTFVNAGILRKSGGLGSSAVTPFHFHNPGGHIEVTSGNVRLPFSNAIMAGGDFDVGSGASLDLPGGIYTGSFTGSGTGQVRMNQGARHTAGAGGAELNLDPGMLRMTRAALNGGPDGFTIAATSDLTATQGGGISFEGLVKNMGVIHHEAGPGGPLQVFGTLENHGVYLLDPGGWLSIPTTSNGTGTFANVAGGTLIKEPGPTEATIAGHFTNPGGDIIVEDGILTFFESVDNAGGDVIVEDGGTMRWAFGNYSQTSGTTTVLLGGTLTSPAVAILGGSLSGDGTINASGGVANDGGVVAPGSSPGVLTINGAYSQTAAGSLAVELNGSAPGSGYDQLVVNGAVTLAGALSVSLGFTSTVGDTFRFIDNDGADAVAGTFVGLAEATEFASGARRFRISYLGGTGNDVTLTDLGGANAPPTAHAGGPYDIDEGEDLQLISSASDPDGDGLSYSWDVNGDGFFGDVTGADPALSWAALVALGITDGPTSRDVYVQVSDGINPAVISAPVLLEVQNRAPGLSVTGPTTIVRGQSGNFLFTVSDVAADAFVGFSYEIDWDNDGVVDDTLFGGDTGINHIYAESGSYTAAVTAVDKDGGRGTATHTMSVVNAALQDDPLRPGRLMLVVGGTPGHDEIRLAAGAGPGNVRVRIDGVLEGSFQPTSRLVVYGYDGDDVVRVNRHLTRQAWLYGDEGNDALTGGHGPNVILGGEGDDQLVGRSARDILIGGTGADELRGGPGDDLLISCDTDFDFDEIALDAVQAEWLSGRGYARRLANLQNIANPTIGNRLNGDVFLLADGQSSTVSDDGELDVLHGRGGFDAYFLNLDPLGTDVVSGLHPREQQIDTE